jgi:hypothetical protein
MKNQLFPLKRHKILTTTEANTLLPSFNWKLKLGNVLGTLLL